MTCFSCLNPRTKDIRVDIDTARPTTDSSGSLLSLSLFFYMKAEIVFYNLFNTFCEITVHGSDTTGTGSISGILGV